jgi:hypothetical protein
MRSLKLTLVALSLCLLASVATHAEPFVIASGIGTLNVNNNTGSFLFSNAAGNITVDIFGNPSGLNPVAQCQSGCAPGSTVNLGYSVSGGSLIGTATRNGVNYFIGSSEFRINAGSVMLPPAGTFTVNYLLPVTFSGRLNLFLNAGGTDSRPGDLILDVSGTGEVFARFLRDPRGNFVPTNVRYEAPMITPEPGTWLLLGTGLAGIAATLRRRRKA